MNRPTPRQTALFAALGLSLAATAWVATHDAPEDVPATPRRAPAKPGAARPADEWPGAAATARPAWPPTQAQARLAWGDTAVDTPRPPPLPAPVPAAAAPADAEPPPPPFPYQLVGRLTDGATRVVLDGPQRSRVAGVGEVIDGQWRVEAIEPGGLRVRHLPDGPTQTLPFTSS